MAQTMCMVLFGPNIVVALNEPFHTAITQIVPIHDI